MFFRYLAAIAVTLMCTAVPAQTIIVDNDSPNFSIELGSWTVASATSGSYGPNYAFSSASGGGVTARVRFRPDLPTAGYYDIYVWYNSGGNRTTNAPYTIHGADNSQTIRVNQQINGSQWFYIGQARFVAGTGGSVSLANNALPSVVMADAVQFVYTGTDPGTDPNLPPHPSGPDTPEIRGLWVTRFEWPRSTQSATKTQIDNVISAMSQANFNALFMQVRGAMETHYASPNEPWARAGFNHVPQSYDPLEYAISETQAAAMHFHAYINTHVIYQGTSPPGSMPGTQPPHPYYINGNPSNANAREWVFHPASGTPEQLGQGEDNYLWTAPGVPSFQQWVRDQVVYVAENYNVDGVHYDRIRFDGQGSFDPISLVRSEFNHPANPDNLGFRAWNRDQITRFLNDVYGAIAEINSTRPPEKRLIQVSTAPFRGKSQQETVNQMLGAWNSIGAQDFFAPQVYTADMGHFTSTLATNFPLAHGRGVVAGLLRIVGSQTINSMMNQITNARSQGAMGNIIFSYGGLSSGDFTAIKNTVYQNKAPIPDMPWLTSPNHAIIVGNVTGPADEALLDVQLKRNGSNYTWLSGSDGFYAMLKVPVGLPLTLTANPSLHEHPVRSIAVPALSPGEVRRVNIQVGVTSVNDWALY